MFAVRGWAVDASALKPQTEAFERTTSQLDGKPQSSTKRKRADKNRDTAVDANDVGRLWEQHVEGKEPPRKMKKGDHRKSKLQRTAEKKHGHNRVQAVGSFPHAGRDTALDGPARTQAHVESLSSSRKNKKTNTRADRNPGVEPDVSELPESKTGIATGSASFTDVSSNVPQSTKLTPMQSSMRQKLTSARFRHLNQTLYTEPSTKAQELFNQNPDMFGDYHAGFRQQVAVWPENPVDNFLDAVRRRAKIRSPKVFKDKKQRRSSKDQAQSQEVTPALTPLPRTNGTCVIADLGCGDARLAQTLVSSGDAKRLGLKLLSYDLYSPSKHVVKADIANLPLADGSVNVAIFCLALMGTNWISFIEEAYRVLHWKGELWVAEIKSRFGQVSKAGKPVEHSVGGKRKLAAMKKAQDAKKREQEEINEQETLQTAVDGVVSNTEGTDVSAFVEVLKRRGFALKSDDKSIDLRNKMFVKMEFVKALTPSKGKGVAQADEKGAHKPKLKFIPDADADVSSETEAKVLKPCLYKIR